MAIPENAGSLRGNFPSALDKDALTSHSPEQRTRKSFIQKFTDTIYNIALARSLPGVNLITAPPKEAPTETPEKVKEKPKKKEIPGGIGPKKIPDKKPEEKEPEPETDADLEDVLVQKPPKKIRNLKMKIASGILAAAGVYAALGATHTINLPLFNHIETYSPFDNSKLDTGKQTIVLGQNAREATPDEILAFRNSPLPEMNPNPKTMADLTTMSGRLSLDMQEAGNVEVSRDKGQQMFLGGKTINAPGDMEITIEKLGDPVGLLFIPEGIKTDTFEVFLHVDPASGELGSIIIKINEDGEYFFEEITNPYGSKAILPTELIKYAPSVGHSKPGQNYFDEVMQGTGKKLNISDNPILFTTGLPNSKMRIMFLTNDVRLLTTLKKAADGNLPITTPH